MAKKANDRIRLPELPIFKKYSLALRQEFASPKELLNALDRTARKVETFLDKAETVRDLVEETPAPAEEPPEAELEAAEVEDAFETELQPSETEDEAALKDMEPPERLEEPSDLEATTGFEPSETDQSEPTESPPEPEESEFRLFEQLAEDEEIEAEFDDRPIWEPEPQARAPRTESTARKSSLPKTKVEKQSGSRTLSRRASKANAKTKSSAIKATKKRRQARPEIVLVSSKGKPLKSRAAKRTTGGKRNR